MTEASNSGGTGHTARYDRRGASRILAELAQPGLFTEAPAPRSRRIEYTSTPLTPEPGRRLTVSQRLYLERFMRPCRPDQVTSATHRITWTDSHGIPNTGHYREDGLGPATPIAAREAVLELWDRLAGNSALTERAARIDDRAHALLAGTTTDHDPVEIFRVGIEATGRTLAQHALLAHQTPYRDPAQFACALRDSGIFAAVATRWYWELQASTYRRGMIPATLFTQSDATVRYSAETVATLRAMKDATIADAHSVMRRATGPEGLTVAEAIEKYHDDLDLISRQYALLPSGARPACLAAMPHRIADEHYSILPIVAERFVEAFTTIHAGLDVVAVSGAVDGPSGDGPIAADDQVFYVPDMTCKHCVRTIGGVLESMGIRVADIDLVSKRVVAEFRSPRNRARAFEAIRDGGYNPSAVPVRSTTEPETNREQAAVTAESTR
ncbi:heavy-metal-associated domain-containing protein [Nocardia cyriacigeorgica]|uniref:heavy-metal-associated domain-containing protein n=1 Tax=Nocardia cyriacigeorgica TaxID=135487 RepID=UPI0024559EB2|nr:heavy metal-associated domain-containing protein [Nocardia cyriacigeorgica]